MIRQSVLSCLAGMFMSMFVHSAWATIPVQVDNLTPYDEATIAWPGQNVGQGSVQASVVSLRIRPGEGVVPLMPYGRCYFIDSKPSAGLSVEDTMVSLVSLDDWHAFQQSHPSYITITECCPKTEVTNATCGGIKKILPADRKNALRTLAYGSYYADVYQCLSQTADLPKWHVIGGMKASGCYGSVAPSNTP